MSLAASVLPPLRRLPQRLADLEGCLGSGQRAFRVVDVRQRRGGSLAGLRLGEGRLAGALELTHKLIELRRLGPQALAALGQAFRLTTDGLAELGVGGRL